MIFRDTKTRIPTQLIVRDAADRKRYYVQHSVMRATKTTQQTTHFVSGPCLWNVNIAMNESFRKNLLECVVLTVLSAAPEPLASLLAGTHDDSNDFLTNVMR